MPLIDALAKTELVISARRARICCSEARPMWSRALVRAQDGLEIISQNRVAPPNGQRRRAGRSLPEWAAAKATARELRAGCK